MPVPDQRLLDLGERGAPREGQPQVSHRRLFMQLLVFECLRPNDPRPVAEGLTRAVTEAALSCVIYEDINHPFGLGLLTLTEDPQELVVKLRPVLATSRLAALALRPEYSMLGRTYATGFEADLEHSLLERPRATVKNSAWPYAIWYPLRRSGAFTRLERKEQGAIVREHGEIGRAYGEADLAHDVRLACHGLDARDNEYVIGLVGSELFPLSHVVQSMRGTRQTSEFISQMGPFFVGRAVSYS